MLEGLKILKSFQNVLQKANKKNLLKYIDLTEALIAETRNNTKE